MPIAHGRRPRQRGFRGLGYHFTKASCLPVVLHMRWVQLPTLVKQAVRFGRQHRVELVWAVLESHANILLAKRVATRLGVPLVSTVWDPPYGDWALRAEYDPWSRRVLRHDFADAVRASVRCGVASEGMQRELKERYGMDSVVMIPGIHPRLRRPPGATPRQDTNFIIGFAGNLYAAEAWEALLAALSRVDWRIEGRRVLVRLLGWRAPLETHKRVHIEYLGWRSVEETIEQMSQVDVAYLPYWFDKWHREDVRLCFPGKLSVYLAAGRPVLYHGPEDSSASRFFRRFPVGLCCHSLDESEIVESLRRFIVDRELCANAAVAAQAALDEELDLRVFLRRFAELIGIGEGELLPVESVNDM